ncbi:diphthine synthase isoform b [Hygrophoropsis aurantiaca]|uniref:Diphthine synthase isoform b n=1 Tax=Hygrophoropsis aurantiaca TaxID=72124 RepID=A0ACB8ADP9_9AGAM|nr:diphthine synthase isoform b [Hygrophoropsis aurantiaca]
MLYVIGLGLCDEKDITVRGLEAVQRCTRVYLEAYTSILVAPASQLAEFYGKAVIVADREMVETQSDEILSGAETTDVAFLVVGDPFGATTHTDLLLRARARGIATNVIHNASVVNAVGACGLQLYNFGQTVSLVFFTDTWRPDSFYDRIRENRDLGLHTLVLLDIKVKEQSDENLARGRKIYEPPRYMTVTQAVTQLLEIEEARNEHVLDPHTTLALAVSRLGASGPIPQSIRAGTLSQLRDLDPAEFGPPLHSLVIVGRRLHDLEVDYARAFAIPTNTNGTDADADADSEWVRVSREVYGVNSI